MSRDPIVVFRNDDFSALSNLERETEIMRLFIRFGIKQTQFVIPNAFCQDRGTHHLLSEHAEFLKRMRAWKRDGRIEIGLHGYSHQINPSYDARRSEFCGLSLQEQAERIREGKTLLANWLDDEPQVFAAPFNAFDAHTVQALAAARIPVFSAMMLQDSHLKTVSDDVLFVDANLRPHQVRMALESIPHRDQPTVLVVLYHSNMIVSRAGLRELERALRAVASSRHVVVADFETVAREHRASVIGRPQREAQLEDAGFPGVFRSFHREKAVVDNYPVFAGLLGLGSSAVHRPFLRLLSGSSVEELMSCTEAARRHVRRLTLAFRLAFVVLCAGLGLVLGKMVSRVWDRPGSSVLLTVEASLMLGLLLVAYVLRRGWLTGTPGIGEKKRKLLLGSAAILLVLFLDTLVGALR
jgi:predicted deacetylase